MRRERHQPTYDLDEAKGLAEQHRVQISGRIRHFIENRYDVLDKRGFIVGLLDAIEPRNFSKSVELAVVPGLWANVYREVRHADELWYVKFVIERDERVVVNVLSANWEGYIH